MDTMLDRIFYSAATWTGLGLAAGLYYREFTRQLDFTGQTQLSVAHTHALALGMLMLLAVLALAKVFPFEAQAIRLFTWLWNSALALTFGMLVFKGTLQVLGSPLAESKAIAGVSGLGHMLLTGTLVYLFLSLRKAMKAADAAGAVAPADAADAPEVALKNAAPARADA